MEKRTESHFMEWSCTKYDIRDWAPEHEKMGKGVTLSDEEVVSLKEILSKL